MRERPSEEQPQFWRWAALAVALIIVSALVVDRWWPPASPWVPGALPVVVFGAKRIYDGRRGRRRG